MKILLVEDDRRTVEHVTHCLEGGGHDVEASLTGRDGAIRARTGGYGALIVDRMLPGVDGLSLVRGLRADGFLTPILFLTTMSSINDRVQGLEGGADDYLTKPFAAAELLARVNAITRRSAGLPTTTDTTLAVAGLEMDLVRHVVTRDGERIELQKQEFHLLEYLMRSAGQLVTRAMLLENVWKLQFTPSTNIVETHMSRLRTKIGCENGSMIRTVRGAGYIFRGH
jgi:two-component system OmpR family response regulator